MQIAHRARRIDLNQKHCEPWAAFVVGHAGLLS